MTPRDDAMKQLDFSATQDDFARPPRGRHAPSESQPLPVAPASASSAMWLDTVLDEGVMRIDAGGRILEVLGPPALFVASKSTLIGERVHALTNLPAAVADAWSGTIERVFDTQRAHICAYAFDDDGALRHHEARALPLAGGQAVLVIRDVAERERLRAHVEAAALTDVLTELPNLRALRERLAQWMRPGRARDEVRIPVQLLLVDLDRFKQTVDLNGRSVADSLLRVVAQRLRRATIEHRDGRAPGDVRGVRARVPLADDHEDPDVLIARVGGDQFAIAWRQTGDASGDSAEGLAQRGALLANRLLSTLGEPTRLSGQMLFVRGSIGIATFPFDADDPSALFSQADGALARAKKAGRNQFRIHGDDERRDGSALLLPPDDEQTLRAALSAHEFLVVYQPKFQLASSLQQDVVTTSFGDDQPALAPGAVLSIEAFVRWRTSTGTLLVPHQFLPLAESSGVIRPLGDWVLRTAIAEVARHAKSRGIAPGVSINVSLSQLHDRSFVETVAAVLKEHAFPAARLTLEIAETAFLEDIRLVSDVLAELSALGVRLAIDHFGVGTGGLVALKSLPIDEIKIDRSFIAGASIDAFDATIVASLIDMAHNLNIQVTADGVERVDQIASLAKMRCDALQGYFIGEPMAAAQLFALDRLWRATPHA